MTDFQRRIPKGTPSLPLRSLLFLPRSGSPSLDIRQMFAKPKPNARVGRRTLWPLRISRISACFLIAPKGRTDAKRLPSPDDHLPRLPLRMLPSSLSGRRGGREGDAPAAAFGLVPPLLLRLLMLAAVVLVVVGAVYLVQLPVPRTARRAGWSRFR